MSNNRDTIAEAIERQRIELEQKSALLLSLKAQLAWIEKRIKEVEREVAILENFGD